MNISDDAINHATADVLEGARSEARLTQAQFAELAGMSSVTVQKLLTGNQSMKVSQFLKLARATGTSSGKLMQKIEAIAVKMSGDRSNVTTLHPRDMNISQLEREKSVALGLNPDATEPSDD